MQYIDDFELVSPIPENAPDLPLKRFIKNENKEWIGYDISHYWPYRDRQGFTLLYVVRYEVDGKKSTPQLCLYKNKDGFKWRFKGFEGIRPLFNLNKIVHFPDAQIIICEGEKKADLLQQMIESENLQDKFCATCWIGGVGGINKTDWTPLENKKILTWPDNDDAGIKCMEEIPFLIGNTSQYLSLRIPEDKPKKWDVADAILIDNWNFKNVLDFIKENKYKPDFNIPDKIITENQDAPFPEEINLPESESAIPSFPFKCLGYDGEYCFYLPQGTRQVMPIKRCSHTSGELVALAPLQYWENEYPSKQGPCWRQAGSDLLRISEQIGIYDSDRQRGRGAWLDKGRSVLHLGDKLIVDGEYQDLKNFKTHYIYEAASPLDCAADRPLSKQEAVKFQQLSDMLFWEKSIYSKLFAGWCVTACICGALKHRPHLWLTARAGAGKTTVIDEIMHPILGSFARKFKSDTTEPGIRQTLGSDALAVVIDEFEPDTFNANEKIQNILRLARAAFSDDGSLIAKGGQNHKAVTFQIRSCFFMSSVSPSIHQKADLTRTSVITLDSPHNANGLTKEQHLEKLNNKIAEVITEEWCAAFRLRAIKLIPVIKENIKTFTKLVSEKIGNRRSGDQVGALIAGAFSLTSDTIVNIDKAREWVDNQDWDDQRSISGKSDEIACLTQILEATIKNPVKNDNISIAELLQYLKDWTPSTVLDTLMEQPEYKSLNRIGIQFEKDDNFIYISDCHRELKTLMRGSPWPKSWGILLKRIEGAIPVKAIRFAGKASTATGLPWDSVFGD